jgi:hypothetical protein
VVVGIGRQSEYKSCEVCMYITSHLFIDLEAFKDTTMYIQNCNGVKIYVLKSSENGFWFGFLRMGPIRKYLPRLPHLLHFVWSNVLI